jgi:hypothetical protein
VGIVAVVAEGRWRLWVSGGHTCVAARASRVSCARAHESLRFFFSQPLFTVLPDVKRSLRLSLKVQAAALKRSLRLERRSVHGAA